MVTASSEPRNNLLGELIRTFTARGADGAYVFDAEQIRGAVAWLLIASSPHMDAHDGQRAVTALGEMFGFGAMDTPQQTAEKVQVYYRQHPIQPALKKQLECVFREALTQKQDQACGLCQQLLGHVRPVMAPQNGERPNGSVRAGPAARFMRLADAPGKKLK